MIEHFNRITENLSLSWRGFRNIDGTFCIARAVLDYMLAAPFDILPSFQGPAGSRLKRGRGKDHPRYGRFIYAIGKHYRPEYVVEVGTFAGGTAIGWATALKENDCGKLICVDNDSYSAGTYPEIARRNLSSTGIKEEQFDLLSGDAGVIIPELAQEYMGRVDFYLVDADHAYEGALSDLENGLPMLKPGGFLLVHDVDRNREMLEATPEHPWPVYEAFMKIASEGNFEWCILKFIRKHLGIIKV